MPKRTPPEDILARIDVRAPDDCWEWTGAKSRGYGQLSFAGEHWQSHRLVYALLCGPIPVGYEVCHTCDNPLCCNIAHLWLGTHAENIADRDRKGRGRWHQKYPESVRRGERNSNAKLTTEAVRLIRKLARAGVRQKRIADVAGVSAGLVSQVIQRDKWAHVPDVEDERC